MIIKRFAKDKPPTAEEALARRQRPRSLWDGGAGTRRPSRRACGGCVGGGDGFRPTEMLTPHTCCPSPPPSPHPGALQAVPTSLRCATGPPNRSERRSPGPGGGWGARGAEGVLRGRTLLPPRPRAGRPEGLEHGGVASGPGMGCVGEFSPRWQAVRAQRRDGAVLHRAGMPQDGEGGSQSGERHGQ